MSFFGKGQKTAQQKAQWAKTRLMLRGAALVYLVVFIVIPMINPETEDIDSMSPMVRYAIIAFFILACGGLAVATIMDYIKGQQKGLFSPEAYEDDKPEVVGDDVNETESEDIDEDEEYDDEDEEYDDEDDDYDGVNDDYED